ncbi:hypothetical protein [Nocardia rhizosphaerihabitans]|uniref:Uncharacterized protein n=1 Tax=Nocardia rhizosphaerihabitans TaxID=1691570 RepID=A0ABQ2KKM9_9NOCA|nr:hypothetical protein [Nocardia rhizosphaerihabitans]GGN85878.1 hypothetical protein GCM10011610_40570 [Nocardia rhizosphaerihabitans]
MAEKFQYEPLLFRRAAAKTGSVRDQINGVIDRLETAATARGACWGSDTFGNNFYNGDANNGYGASKTNSTDSARTMAENMNSFSTGQLESARLLEQMEKGNYDGMR